jgi:pyruvate/2-oxoglutarate dehydrogenase complex dihydrolipoamide acyltransferase (E2) component
MRNSKQTPDYHVRPFPRMRRVVIDQAWLAQRKHMIHGLVEVDVTTPRQAIRDHQAATGERLSFTAFLVSCLGHAVDADTDLQAYQDWRGRLIVFDDVDVVTIVEIVADGQSFPLAHIIRAANRRSVREIHDEIRAVQARPAASPSLQHAHAVDWFVRLPAWMRHLVYRAISKRPRVWKQLFGTMVLTAVGMFGAGSGWGLALTAHTLGITVGGISAKSAVVDGSVVTREYLSLTVDFDHDIVDGAPAARFVQHFKELIERGDGLVDAREGKSDRAQPDAASTIFEISAQALPLCRNGETLVPEHTAR